MSETESAHLILGVTGASGIYAARRLIEKSTWPVDLVASRWGRAVAGTECGGLEEIESLARQVYAADDLYAPLSSGSVLTVGMVQAGTTYNVIPTEANLKLKLHYTTRESGEKMVSSIERVSNNIANTYGIVSDDMMPTLEVRGYAPPVVNSP